MDREADGPFAAQEIFDDRDHSHTVDAVVEHHTMDFLLLGNDTAERVRTAVVSANFFDVLGVRPQLGRTFVAADDSPNADPVLVLTYQYWQAHQSVDPHIMGKERCLWVVTKRLGPATNLMMVEGGFVIGDRLVALGFGVLPPGGLDVRLPDALRIHREQRDLLFEVAALAAGTGWSYGISHQGLKALPAV